MINLFGFLFMAVFALGFLSFLYWLGPLGGPLFVLGLYVFYEK